MNANDPTRQARVRALTELRNARVGRTSADSIPLVDRLHEFFHVGPRATWACTQTSDPCPLIVSAVEPMQNLIADWLRETGNVIQSALLNYKAETERYLSSFKSWPLASSYNPSCCDTCRLNHIKWQMDGEIRKQLIERLDEINDALAEVARDVK